MHTPKEIIDSLQKALALVPEVSFMPMGGDYRVYSRGRLFGLLRGRELFLKFSPETLCLFRDVTMHRHPGGLNTCKANAEWLNDPDKLGEAVLYTLACDSTSKQEGAIWGANSRPAGGKRWLARLPWEKALAGCAALAALYFALPHGVLSAVGIRKGTKAENFTVTGFNGEKMRLSDCGGKPVFLYLWETNSQRSIDNLPMLDSLYAAYGDKPVCFIPVTVTSDFNCNVKALIEAKGFKSPVYNGAGQVRAAKLAPMLYLIDHEGYIRKSYSPSNGDQARIASDLETLLRAVPAAPGGRAGRQ